MVGTETTDTRRIATRGGTLDIEMTQAFVDRVRQRFGLLVGQRVDDEHVRLYVSEAVGSAIDNAEQGIVDARVASRVPSADSGTNRAGGRRL